MGDKKSEGLCAKCSRLCFNMTLLIAFIFFIMIPVLHSYTSGWNFLVTPGSWDLVKGFCNFFAVMFTILYLTAGLVILKRWYQSRRLCRLDNCSFYILTLGIFVLGLVGQDYIEKAKMSQAEDFSYTCAELALADGVAPNSFLAEINQVYRNADALLCSDECPCGLRGSLASMGIGPVMPPDGGWPVDNNDPLPDDDDDLPRMLRYNIEDNGPTSVRKCPTYLDRVYGGDEDKQWQYEEVFQQLEEDTECSGICDGLDDSPYEFFLFSNVNNGEPKVTCRSSLSAKIDQHIWFFRKLYLVAIVLTGIMLGLLTLLLLCSIHIYCKKKCGRKGPTAKQIKNNRAKNGMVLGGED